MSQKQPRDLLLAVVLEEAGKGRVSLGRVGEPEAEAVVEPCDLAGLAARLPRWGELWSREIDSAAAREEGAWIRRTFFPAGGRIWDAMRRHFREAAAEGAPFVRLRVLPPPELWACPWECVFVEEWSCGRPGVALPEFGQGCPFLALSSFVSLVRVSTPAATPERWASGVPLEVREPLRVFLGGHGASGAWGADNVGAALNSCEEALRGLVERQLATVQRPAPAEAAEAALEALRGKAPPHVWLFAAHAVAKGPDDFVLAAGRAPLHGLAVAEALERASEAGTTRLVVLGACGAAQAAWSIAARVPAVIAFGCRIDALWLKTVLGGLFASLARGESIDVAVHTVRSRLRSPADDVGAGERKWSRDLALAPVLFLRSLDDRLAPPAAVIAEEEYLKAVEGECSHLQVFGTRPSPPVGTGFVARHLERRPARSAPSAGGRAKGRTGRGAPRAGRTRGRPRIAVGALVDADVRSLVVGEAGTGKSELLRRIAFDLASRESTSPAGRRLLPVRVALRRAGTADVRELLRAEVRRLHPAAAEYVDAWLAERRVVLLVDGLSEFPGDREGLADALAALVAGDAGPCAVIATTRPRSGVCLAGFDEYALAPLEPVHVRRFMAVAAPHAALPPEAVRIACRLPLALRAFAELAAAGGSGFPRGLAATLDEVVRSLLSGGVGREGPPNVGEVLRRAGCLALDDPGLLVEPSRLPQTGLERAVGFARVQGLLRGEHGGEKHEFVHDLLADFFAARHLADLDDTAFGGEVRRRVKRQRWHPALEMCCGLVSPERVAKVAVEALFVTDDVFRTHAALAARCIGEACLRDETAAGRLRSTAEACLRRWEGLAAERLPWMSLPSALEALGRLGRALPAEVLDLAWRLPPDDCARVLAEMDPAVVTESSFGPLALPVPGGERLDGVVVDALAGGAAREVLPHARRILGDWTWPAEARAGAAEALGQIGDAGALEELRPVLVDRHDDPLVRIAAARAIGMLDAPDAPAVLHALLKDEKERPEVRVAVAEALGATGTPEALRALTELFESKDAHLRVRIAALGGILALGAAPRTEILRDLARAGVESRGVQREIDAVLVAAVGVASRTELKLAAGLTTMAGRVDTVLRVFDDIDEALRELGSASPSRRALACQAIVRLADRPEARAAIPDLVRLLQDPNEAVKASAAEALDALGDPMGMRYLRAMADESAAAGGGPAGAALKRAGGKEAIEMVVSQRPGDPQADYVWLQEECRRCELTILEDGTLESCNGGESSTSLVWHEAWRKYLPRGSSGTGREGR